MLLVLNWNKLGEQHTFGPLWGQSKDRGEGRNMSQTAHRSTGMVDGWASVAKCRGGDPDALFVRGAAQQSAKQVCQGCPVVAECLADALDSRIEFGVWGGKTERERRALLRQNPSVASWWNLFAEGRARQAS